MTGELPVVFITLEGRVFCPYHGLLRDGTEYAAGRAVCGCMFVALPDSLLRCEFGNGPQHCNKHKYRERIVTECTNQTGTQSQHVANVAE